MTTQFARPGWWRVATAALASAIVIGGAPLRAQEFRGAILGVVSDGSGGVLPGVTVTVTNVETNVPTQTVTAAEGRYQARYLNPGTYTVTASLAGFKTVIRPRVVVGVGDSLSVVQIGVRWTF